MVTSANSLRTGLIPALLVLTYAFVPADPSGLLAGWPWRDPGGIVLSALLSILLWQWCFPAQNRKAPRITAMLALAVVARVALFAALLPEGWSSMFAVTSDGVSTVQKRIGRRAPDGGVIDLRINLTDQSPALQFLNDGTLSTGGPDAAPAVSLEARWRGYTFVRQDTTLLVHVTGTENVTVLVDGVPTKPSAVRRVTLQAGSHEISVMYSKPAGASTRLSVTITAESGERLPIFAAQPMERQVATHSAARVALLMLDSIVIITAVVWAWLLAVAPLRVPEGSAVRCGLSSSASVPRILVVLPIVAFMGQGLFAAAAYGSRLNVFQVGDDMRRYAWDGRNVFLNGLLMNDGQPLFEGEPFFFYPLYPYFVAFSHWLFDESFYGLVLLQFILLGATVGTMARLTASMFGRRAGFIALGMLCVLAEVDFVRYYTVSVFTDNLYYPLVAGAVATMWRAETTRCAKDTIAAGMLGGLATLARPSMLPALPLFLAWILWRGSDRRNRRAAVVAAGLFSASWMAVVGVATLRNWLVSGRFVLLAESSLQILFFLAPPGVSFHQYMTSARPSVPETLVGALRMFWDHPTGVLTVEAKKLAFMLGFTNVTPGFRLHPEFIALNAGYVIWWLTRDRTRPAGAAVHLALLAHVLIFLIASPASYGYKNMLTSILLVIPFTADLVARARDRVARVADQAR